MNQKRRSGLFLCLSSSALICTSPLLAVCRSVSQSNNKWSSNNLYLVQDNRVTSIFLNKEIVPIHLRPNQYFRLISVSKVTLTQQLNHTYYLRMPSISTKPSVILLKEPNITLLIYPKGKPCRTTQLKNT